MGWTGRGQNGAALRLFYLKLGEKIAAKYADEVIVLSKSVQDYFRNTYGRETVLIENAVVPVEYTPCSLLSERLGLERGGYVLFLARIVPEKGLHYLIEAFLNCSTDKKLVIAGEIPDTEYGGKIRKLAAGTDRIIFTGFAQGDVMAALYSNLRAVRPAQRDRGACPYPAGGNVRRGAMHDERYSGEHGCAG